MKKFVIIVLALSCASLSAASTDPFKLEYGKVFPIKAFGKTANDLPILLESFKAPIPRESGLRMFLDYEIVYVKDTGVVYSAQATRAYASLEECESDKILAEKALLDGFSGIKEIKEGQYESREFVVDLNCLFSNTSRYPELSLSIFHKPTEKEVKIPHNQHFHSTQKDARVK